MARDVFLYTHSPRRIGGSTSPVDMERCRACVDFSDSSRFSSFGQCQNKVKVHRDVGGESVGFCGVHDPVKVAERRAKRDAADRAEREKRQAADDRRYKRPVDYTEALRAIAAGHNDPRALACEVLEKWGDMAPEGEQE